MKKILTSVLLFAVLVSSLVVPSAASGLFPSTFTPSVTAKTAPEIVPYEKGDVEYSGTLVRIAEDGTETVVKDLTALEVTIVSYAEVQRGGASEAVTKRMTTAYGEIAGTEDIGTVCSDLEGIVGEIDKNQKTTDLVASDLFDLALAGADLAVLEGNDDVVFRVTFKFNLAEGEKAPVIMHRDDAFGIWRALPYESVKISGEDRITVDFDGLCPVAILRVGAAETIAPSGMNNIVFVLSFVILAFLLVVLINAIVVSVKRRNRRLAIIESEEGFLDGYYRISDKKYAKDAINRFGFSIERINKDDD